MATWLGLSAVHKDISMAVQHNSPCTVPMPWAFLIVRMPPFQAVSGLPDSSGGDRDGGHDTDSQMNSGSDAETKESSSDKYLHHVSKSSHSISKSGGGSSNKKASNKKARNR